LPETTNKFTIPLPSKTPLPLCLAVGSHKDNTAAGSPQEFVECKALLQYPKKNTYSEQQTIALGRGGFGGGIYGCMIVDHPEKP
jgi:hypothetical protein